MTERAYSTFFPKVEEAAQFLEGRVSIRPRILLVLTGGVRGFIDAIDDPQIVDFSDIPHFGRTTAEGHEGNFVFGTIQGLPVAAMQGRFHYYEGHHPSEVVFPHFVLAKLGVQVLINTNAVGGIRNDLDAGDIMLVTDHINMMGTNPLIGIAVQRESDQFTNMIDAYDPGLADVARRAAGSCDIALKEGVYVAVSGPCYETRAEVRSLRTLGGDAVGMSTLPEVVAARFLGVKVLALSCIANAAADRHGGEMSHGEVLQAMSAAAPKIIRLLQTIVGDIAKKRVTGERA